MPPSPLDHLDENIIRKPQITSGPIFLSYSRQNRDFAQALYTKLERMGFTLWRDVHGIPAGADDWWQSIQQAIRECETVILCMSLPALKSPVVGDEWSYARTQGKRIIPVLADDIWDHPEVKAGTFTVPNWMRRKNWLDFRVTVAEPEAAWANLIRTLNEHSTPKRFINMVEELPPRFVRRPEDIDRAVRGLIDDKNDAVAMTTALNGAGGYGKTTLAKAIARDVRIVGAFDDGILWVTLGEKLLELSGDTLTKALIDRAGDLIYALIGTRPEITTLEMARTKLQEAIGDLHILLVIDDVWDAVHLSPFLVKTAHSSHLITTRNLNTVDRKDILTQTVDRMKPIEAVELLGAGFDDAEVKQNDAALKKLARDLREYPLVLALANIQIANYAHDMRLSLADAIALAEETLNEQGVLGFDDTSSADRHDAVSKTLDLSIRQLTPADRQQMYRELAIFPEDVVIPLVVLEKYWGLSKVATLQFCQTLYRKTALLHSFEGLAIRIHDVYRDCLMLWEQDRLRALHRRLTDSWGMTIDTVVTSLPDLYCWKHLAYHLIHGGQADLLRTLLLDYRYLRTKLGVTDANALLADCDALLKLGKDEPIRLVRSAISMSAHMLREDPNVLGHQLVGRMMGHRKLNGELRAFTNSIPALQPGLYPVDFDSDYTTHEQAGGALIRILRGHTAFVNAVAYAPDGACLVSASDDSTLIVWDAATGEAMRTLRGHMSAVNAVAYAPDGARLVSASNDSTLIVWDAATGEALRTLHGHMSAVNAVAYAPDGARLVSASWDETLIMWDAATGEALRTLHGHTAGVRAVAYAPDGACLVSASDDHTLIVWDAATGEAIRTLHGHTAGVRAVAYAPDGAHLLSASWDKTLIMWDAVMGETLRTLRGHTAFVSAVVYAPDGACLVSTSDDSTLIVWDAPSPLAPLPEGEHRTLHGHMSAVTAIAYAPDGACLVSASDDSTLIVWDAATREALRTLRGHTAFVKAVAYAPDGACLVSASNDSTLIMWDAATGEALRTLEGHTAGVNAVAYAPDGARLLSASWDSTLIVWDAATGEALRTLRGHTARVNAVAYAPDGAHLLSASWDKTLIMWDAATGEALRNLRGHTAGVNAVAYTPDGACLVSASDDSTLIVWDAATGETLCNLRGHMASVNAVAYAPDGARLVSVSSDNTLIVWDTATGDRMHTLYGDAPFWSVAWSRDGEFIAAGDQAGRVLFLRWRDG